MKSKKKISLTIILIVLCIFFLINVIWLFYVQFVFTPLTSNFDNKYSALNYVADLLKRDEQSITDSTYFSKSGSDIDDNIYYYVAYPHYLQFSGKYETQISPKNNSKFNQSTFVVNLKFLNIESIEYVVEIEKSELSYFQVTYDLNSDSEYDKFHSPEQLNTDEADKIFSESQEQLELLQKLSNTMFD